MTRAILLLATLLALTGGCATMEAERTRDDVAAPAPPSPSMPPPPPPQSRSRVGAVVSGGRTPPADCALTIQFGSYGMGIDGDARSRIEALLLGDRNVVGLDSQRWGYEGEVGLCVRTRSAADAARLFRAARQLIPPRRGGSVALRTRTGLRYETPPPRR